MSGPDKPDTGPWPHGGHPLTVESPRRQPDQNTLPQGGDSELCQSSYGSFQNPLWNDRKNYPGEAVGHEGDRGWHVCIKWGAEYRPVEKRKKSDGIKAPRCGGSLPFRSASVPKTLIVKIQVNP